MKYSMKATGKRGTDGSRATDMGIQTREFRDNGPKDNHPKDNHPKDNHPRIIIAGIQSIQVII